MIFRAVYLIDKKIECRLRMKHHRLWSDGVLLGNIFVGAGDASREDATASMSPECHSLDNFHSSVDTGLLRMLDRRAVELDRMEVADNEFLFYDD